MIRATLKGLVAHKLRFLLTALAVMLGVAFMSGTLVYGDTLQHGFDGLFASNYAGTDAVVRAPVAFETNFGEQRDPLDATIVQRLRAVSGVAVAEGYAEGYAQLVDRDGKAIGASIGPPTLGTSWSTTPDLNPMSLEPGSRPPTSSNDIVIDARSARLADVEVGDEITVLSRGAPEEFTISGIARYGEAESPLGASISAFRLDVAQRLMGLVGKVNQVGVVAEDGISQTELRDRLIPVVREEKLEVLTGSEIIAEGQEMTRDALGFFNTFLLVFALIALFVGSFIIFNTFSIIVAQRTREIGLLRAIGASQRQVLTGVVVESVVLAVVASVIGLGAGVLLAEGLRALLGSFGLDMPGVATQIRPSSMVSAFVAGFVVTIVAAVWPARRAARIAPLAALREMATDESSHGYRRAVAGVSLVVLGGAAMVLGLFADISNVVGVVGAGAAVVFLGVAVLGPIIARPLASTIAWPLPRLRGMTGMLARENALRNPKRTSATASALMVGVALVTLITIIAGSAKASIHEQLDSTMRADFVVATSQLGMGGFSSELAQRIAMLPDVSQTTGVRFGPAQVGGGVRFVSGVNPGAIEAMFELEILDGNLAELSDSGVAIAETAARDNGWTVGELVPITFARSGLDEFRIEAIYGDNDAFDDYILNMHAFGRNFVQPLDMQVYVKLYDGVDPLAARAAIEDLVSPYPSASLLDRDEFSASYAARLDQMLNIVYALLALAVVIALIGIANTLALSIYERTRELGLLRAVGLSRRQLRAVVRWEAVVIALLGALLGVVIGVVFGWVLVTALEDQGITRVAVPFGTLAIVVGIAWVSGVVAALRPSQRAARLDILRAIASH